MVAGCLSGFGGKESNLDRASFAGRSAGELHTYFFQIHGLGTRFTFRHSASQLRIHHHDAALLLAQSIHRREPPTEQDCVVMAAPYGCESARSTSTKARWSCSCVMPLQAFALRQQALDAAHECIR